MRCFICVLGLVLTSFAGPLHAGSLLLTYEGVLADGSYDPNNNDLSGLSFVVNAVFDSTPVGSFPGAGQYMVTHLSATVDNVTYEEVDPGYFDVEIFDTSLLFPFFPLYVPALVGDTAFAPVFLKATPAISGDAAGPTDFSLYVFSLDSMLELLTDSGFLTLVYDGSAGVSASITAVPEPSTAVLAAMGGITCLLVARRRKLGSAA